MNEGGPEANNVLVDHLCAQKKIVKTTLTYGCYNNTFLEAKVAEICPFINWGKNFYFKTSSFFQA